jgi:hypothetical protein
VSGSGAESWVENFVSDLQVSSLQILYMVLIALGKNGLKRHSANVFSNSYTDFIATQRNVGVTYVSKIIGESQNNPLY